MQQDIDKIIQDRRSVFPNSYKQQAIEADVIWEILENANWAPTHKKTEPWRFVVFLSEASKQELSNYLAEAYRQSVAEEKFSEIQQKKISEKPLQSGAVIAICMKRSEESMLPEWEEIAAVSCAVQNMWLSCTARNIGSYWATPGIILRADEFLGLESNERCLGLFYMGYLDEKPVASQRTPVEEKTRWR
ncbi:MAG: nitroreductase [Saprospiraceae bacterium]|nr:nitroreductase [Saprospiraceae bacterium]